MSTFEEDLIQDAEDDRLTVEYIKSYLPQELKDIIVLRYYNSLSLTDISRMMGLSYGVTKLRHKEALNRLRSYIG